MLYDGFLNERFAAGPKNGRLGRFLSTSRYALGTSGTAGIASIIPNLAL
jgi:hypothetical protein